MHAHCEDIKRRIPDAVTIFIGPCLSKKDEAYSASIDAALTFEELSEMFDRRGIVLEKRETGEMAARAVAPGCFPLRAGYLNQ